MSFRVNEEFMGCLIDVTKRVLGPNPTEDEIASAVGTILAAGAWCWVDGAQNQGMRNFTAAEFRRLADAAHEASSATVRR